jgi:hypothetical protein
MKKTAIAFALVLSFAVACGLALAADDQPANVAGAWNMTFEGRNGTVTQSLKLVQDAGKLTGTLTSQRGDSPITGTITGNAIDFTVKRTTPNGDFSIEYTGTVDGDSMKGSFKMGDNTRDWTAARQK